MEFIREGNALVCRRLGETLRLEPWGPEALRVRATMGERIDPEPLALTEPPEAAESVVRISEAGASVSCGSLRAEVNPFGVLSFFTMNDAPGLQPNRQGGFWKQLLSAFNLKELLKQRELVWVFLVLTVYFVAFNVYYPHVGNYMIYYLGFSADSIGLIQGVALIFGMLAVIPASKMLAKNKFVLAAAVSVLLSIVGVGMLGVFGRPERVDPTTILNWNLLIGLFFFGCGYIMFMQVLSVWMKQLFPEEAKGQFEGFRIIFFVLIPWVVSPFIANPIIKRNGEILDANGLTAYLPTHVLFLVSTLLILATFIPLFFAARERKKREGGQ